MSRSDTFGAALRGRELPALMAHRSRSPPTRRSRAARPQRIAPGPRLASRRAEAHFCDVALRSLGGEVFRAHRLVLSMVSDPLFAMLKGGFAEGQQPEVVACAWPRSSRSQREKYGVRLTRVRGRALLKSGQQACQQATAPLDHPLRRGFGPCLEPGPGRLGTPTISSVASRYAQSTHVPVEP